MAKKYCYLFSEGNASMREILGGKGANLAEMTNIGLPVPQGFTISTEAWGTGRPMLVISARLAPLPPRISRMLALPSEKR